MTSAFQLVIFQMWGRIFVAHNYQYPKIMRYALKLDMAPLIGLRGLRNAHFQRDGNVATI